MVKNLNKTKKDKSLNIDSPLHVTGRTKYVDDIPELSGTLFAKVFYSSIAHGKITRLDISKAAAMEGVVKVVTCEDIPGENQVGGIIADEPLLADGLVDFIGQPIVMILATEEIIARKALKLIEVKFKPLKVIVDPREAHKKGSLLSDPRHFQMGDTKKAFKKAKYIFEGEADSGGQEHVYLEPQGAYAIPKNNDCIQVISSTQGPTAVQRTIARALGVSMNEIEVDVNRIGGGFGGKEDQASMWATFCALGTYLTKKPVKYILDRHEDLQMTGKRHPYRSDYKIGLDKDLKIVAFEGNYFQNGGATADLSPAVLERTLFHATNSYYVPNVDVHAYPCRTNLHPHTAFRGFGGPQGMFVIECAIHHAARALGVPANKIQEKNLLINNNEFSYGQKVQDCEAKNTWNQAKKKFDFAKLKKEVAAYNKANKYSKKGIAFMPICFGISFTNTMMNNARALVHVYSDGSVGISTGAVEMGQGVSSKMIQVAALCFGLKTDEVRLETTNTTRVANTSPTAASATADLNGKALQDACDQILVRLRKLVKKEWGLKSKDQIHFQDGWVICNRKKMKWNELILTAFQQRVNLSAKGHYSTPKIHFDKKIGKGHPFAYHVFGTSIFTCTVDCIRGTYDFDKVQLIHDFGTSMNKLVDLGQIEGGLVQGMGWMTIENLLYDEEGRLKSNSLANYKIPDIHYVPKKLDVEYLDTKGSDLAILKSKAVGEPPLMYGIGAYFALYNAVLAYNKDANIPYESPMTTEKILMGLYSKKANS